ncbi:unnamed protein product, partial [Cyprideis torosa]
GVCCQDNGQRASRSPLLLLPLCPQHGTVSLPLFASVSSSQFFQFYGFPPTSVIDDADDEDQNPAPSCPGQSLDFGTSESRTGQVPEVSRLCVQHHNWKPYLGTEGYTMSVRNQDNSKFGGECMAGKRRILQRILQTKDSTNEGFYKRNEGFYKQPTTRSDFPEPQALAQKLVALLKDINVFFLQGCPSGFEFNPGLGKCYFFSTTYATWDDAEDHCASLREGVHLASIHSESEMNYILSIFEKCLVVDCEDKGRKALRKGMLTPSPLNHPTTEGESGRYVGLGGRPTTLEETKLKLVLSTGLEAVMRKRRETGHGSMEVSSTSWTGIQANQVEKQTRTAWAWALMPTAVTKEWAIGTVPIPLYIISSARLTLPGEPGELRQHEEDEDERTIPEF